VDIDASSLIAGLFVSSVGFVLFSYGKKMGRPPQMVGGLLFDGVSVFRAGGGVDAGDRRALVRADLGGGAAGVLRACRAGLELRRPHELRLSSRRLVCCEVLSTRAPGRWTRVLRPPLARPRCDAVGRISASMRTDATSPCSRISCASAPGSRPRASSLPSSSLGCSG
jgi:hypothetical protein